MTVSVIIITEYYYKARTDIWQTLCRYRNLERLEFCVPFTESDKSMPNIEPLNQVALIKLTTPRLLVI